MKNIKTYKLFTESLKDRMIGKTDDDIKQSLLSLDIEERLEKIKSLGLDKSFLPPKEEIENFLKNLSIEEILEKNKRFGLPTEYLPPREEIEKFLPNDTNDRLKKINRYNLDKSFLPPRNEIMKILMKSSISQWRWKVKDYGLDKSYLPTDEYIKQEILSEYEDNEELKEKANALLLYLIDNGIVDDDMKIYYLEPNGDHYGMTEFVNLEGDTWESYAIGTDEEADKAAYECEDNLIDEIGYGGFSNGYIDQFIDGKEFADDYFTDEEDYIRDNFRDFGIETEDELNSSAQQEVNKLREEIERLENERDILDSSDEGADELDQEIEDLESEIEDIEQDEDNYDMDEDSFESYCDEQKENIANDPVSYLNDLGYDEKTINSMLERYIDRDELIESLISENGRGQCISSYDGEENEIKYNDTWYYIYRTN